MQKRPFRFIPLIAASFSSVAAAADEPNQQQATSIRQSFDNTRFQVIGGAALDKDQAGYYQLVVSPSNFVKNNVCPTSRDERNRLKSLEASIWSWALKKKIDWGVGMQIAYNGNPPNFDSEEFVPDIEHKFFSVKIDGKDPEDCEPSRFDNTVVRTGLIPLKSSSPTQDINVQVTNWYNKTNDRGRIDNMLGGGFALLGLVGIPVGLLDKIRPAATDEIKTTIDRSQQSARRFKLSPHFDDEMKYETFVGLRTPTQITRPDEAKITLEIRPVSSMFSQSEATYQDFSGKHTEDILGFDIPHPVAKTAANPNGVKLVKLRNFLFAEITSYDKFRTSTDYATASAHCDSLITEITDKFRFSDVDTAVVAYMLAKAKGEANANMNELHNYSCLMKPQVIQNLAKVNLKIEVPQPEEEAPEELKGTSKEQMKVLMNKFGSFRATDPEFLSSDNWSIFRYPFLLADPNQEFGWSKSFKVVDETNRSEIKDFLNKHFSGVGCWAYFDERPFTLRVPLGSPLQDANDGNLRKGAGLLRPIGGGTAKVIQFRFDAFSDNPKISGISVVASDDEAKERMLSNPSCREGIDGKEWMQSFLRGE